MWCRPVNPGVDFPVASCRLKLGRGAFNHSLDGSVMMNRSRSQYGVAPSPEPIVYVVDDERLVRETLGSLLRSVGLRVRLFESAHELLQEELENAPSCLILDIRLPRLGGLDLQTELAKSNIMIPII